MSDVADIGIFNLILLSLLLVEFGCSTEFHLHSKHTVFMASLASCNLWIHTNLERFSRTFALIFIPSECEAPNINIRIYVVFGAFLLRYDLTLLAVRALPNLSNVVIKLLGV